MSFLRLVVWIVLLIIVVSIAYAVFAGREYTSPQPLQVAKPLWFAPSYEYRPICTDNIYIDPWTAVNYFGLNVENNRIVYKYTNTSEELLRRFSATLPSIRKPTTIYYSILVALVAIPKSSYSTVYDLHPLPVSQNDVENLTKLSLCFYLPSEGFEAPSIEPAVTANTSYIIKNVTVYKRESFGGLTVLTPVNVTKIINVVTYLPTANISILNSTRYVDPVNVTGFATGSLSAERVGEVVCGNTTAYFADYNKMGYIIYVRSVYRVSYSYTLGYIANGTQVAILMLISLRLGTSSLPIFWLGAVYLTKDPTRIIGPSMKVVAEAFTAIPLAIVFKKLSKTHSFTKASIAAFIMALISRVGAMLLLNYLVTPYWLLWAGWMKTFETAYDFTMKCLPYIAIFNATVVCYVVPITLGAWKTIRRLIASNE